MSNETTPQCPKCHKELQKVRRDPNSMLNSDQFDAVRAGDWFCECSHDGRGGKVRCYFWDSELVPTSALQSAAPPETPEPPRPKCPDCGHAIHPTGPCLNMASDNECDCPAFEAAPTPQEAHDTPKCFHCLKRAATCLGAYDMGGIAYACDSCCGHGNEDGWCVTLADIPERVSRFRFDYEQLEAAHDKMADKCVGLESSLAAVTAERDGLREARSWLLTDRNVLEALRDNAHDPEFIRQSVEAHLSYLNPAIERAFAAPAPRGET